MSASPKHELTNDERDAITCLYQVTFPVASWDKRFARDVLFPALQTGMLGDKSAPQLWRLLIRYRRQWGHTEKGRLLKLAETLAAPDFRKQKAMETEQARIDEMKREYNKAMEAK